MDTTGFENVSITTLPGTKSTKLRVDTYQRPTVFYAVGYKRSTDEVITRAGRSPKQARKNIIHESGIDDTVIYTVVDNFPSIKGAELECRSWADYHIF